MTNSFLTYSVERVNVRSSTLSRYASHLRLASFSVPFTIIDLIITGTLLLLAPQLNTVRRYTNDVKRLLCYLFRVWRLSKTKRERHFGLDIDADHSKLLKRVWKLLYQERAAEFNAEGGIPRVPSLELQRENEFEDVDFSLPRHIDRENNDVLTYNNGDKLDSDDEFEANEDSESDEELDNKDALRR